VKLKSGLFILVLTVGSVMATKAQGGGGARRTIEERVQIAHTKIDSAFKLDTEKQVKVDSAFASYYRQQDKLREELRSGGDRPDYQVMRERMQPLIEARDKELKTLLSDEQFKKWKDEIEPAMMPRRRDGGNRQ
jgi:hypothetical protein